MQNCIVCWKIIQVNESRKRHLQYLSYNDKMIIIVFKKKGESLCQLMQM